MSPGVPAAAVITLLSPTFMCPYPWLLLMLLQKWLLEVFLLVLMVDHSQSLTWVMAVLSMLLFSAALPWWQKERVPACQEKGSTERWRLTIFMTFLSCRWQHHFLTFFFLSSVTTHTHTHNTQSIKFRSLQASCISSKLPFCTSG